MIDTTGGASYLDRIDNLFADYLAANANEKERLSVLIEQLAARDPGLNSRYDSIGHLTGSALVVTAAGNCLLINHKFLQRWLQPGGHLDFEEWPETGARRELKEETGLDLSALPAFLIDVDSHAIPANEKKQEPAHLHHDFQYVFNVQDETAVTLDPVEVSDFKWLSLGELKAGACGNRLARVAGKIEALARL